MLRVQRCTRLCAMNVSPRRFNCNVELIFIHGAPGTGKGTLCKNTVEATKSSDIPFEHISIGDLLRQELSKPSILPSRSYVTGSYLSNTINEAIQNGTVLPSYITTGLLLDEIEKKRQSCKLNELKILIDGFPRNLDNLNELQKVKPSYLKWNKLITLECSKEIILNRLLSNSRNREDDTKKIILKRLQTWNDGTYRQVENHFKKESNLYFKSFNTNPGVKRIYSNFIEFISNNLPDLENDDRNLNSDIISQFKEGEMPSYVYSYPTKKAYSLLSSSSSLNEENIISNAWNNYSGPLNIYFHIPFCQMKCSFCNLFTTMNFTEQKSDRYIEALKLEIQTVFSQIQNKNLKIETIHFGGGTPSIIHPDKIHQVLKTLYQYTDKSDLKEIAIEATPGSIYSNLSIIEEYSKMGITRLSVGVQTFDKEELHSVRRENEFGLSEKVLEMAVQSSIKNINCDLIFGLPEQSKKVFLENIKTAIQLKVDTITLYCLAVRKKTNYGTLKSTKYDDSAFFNNAELFDWYECAVQLLKESGYSQKTLVLFGKGNKQEEIEFEGVPTLGFGAGARSYSPCIHYSSDNYFSPQKPHEIISRYYEQVEQHKVSVLSYVQLSKDEEMRKFIIMQLLYEKGLDLHCFRGKFNQLFESTFNSQYKLLIDNGLASVDFVDNRPFLRLHNNLQYSSAIAQLFFSDNILQSESSYQ